MRHFLIIALTLVLVPTLPLFASENREHIFTNNDLGKTGGTSAPEKPVEREKNIRSGSKERKKSSENRSQEAWCQKGTRLHNRIDRAKAELDAAENKFRDDSNKPCLKKKQKCPPPSDKKVVRARKNLTRAETDLSALEQSAHRQGIPPGWLNCNFSY